MLIIRNNLWGQIRIIINNFTFRKYSINFRSKQFLWTEKIHWIIRTKIINRNWHSHWANLNCFVDFGQCRKLFKIWNVWWKINFWIYFSNLVFPELCQAMGTKNSQKFIALSKLNAPNSDEMIQQLKKWSI